MKFKLLTTENIEDYVDSGPLAGFVGVQEVKRSIEYYERQIAGLTQAYDRAKSDTTQAQAALALLRKALNDATKDTRPDKWSRDVWFFPRWCTALRQNGAVFTYVGRRNIDAFLRNLNGRMDIVAAWKARALGAEEERNQYRDKLIAIEEELEDRREVDRQIRMLLGLSEIDSGTLGTIGAVQKLIQERFGVASSTRYLLIEALNKLDNLVDEDPC